MKVLLTFHTLGCQVPSCPAKVICEGSYYGKYDGVPVVQATGLAPVFTRTMVCVWWEDAFGWGLCGGTKLLIRNRREGVIVPVSQGSPLLTCCLPTKFDPCSFHHLSPGGLGDMDIQVVTFKVGLWFWSFGTPA